MRILLQGGTIINEGRTFKGDLLIHNDRIEKIIEGELDSVPGDIKVIDATGKYVIPGVIDDQVHFREPGLTHKGDIREGSRAAAAGGVTSFMDMPNVKPPTVTNELLREKQQIAKENAAVNYSFYLGATVDNIDEIKKVDPHTTCGIKIFMGSSTGNMLVDSREALEKIFAESPILIATHCEDSPTIDRNLELYKQQYGEGIPPFCHPLIRNRECCYTSSSLAAELARKHNSRLHILHLSTKEELELLDQGPRTQKHITGEVCVHHLWFNDQAYHTKGNLVKWNPAIKTEEDRQALLQALNDNRLDIIATDHAPHLPEEKAGVYTKSASGGPMVQHSLTVMLELMEKGQITLENIVDKMCHAPADIFHVEERGYLREGYKADIAIFEKHPWTVKKENLLYKCGWSPLEDMSFTYRVSMTLVNGQIVYDHGKINDNVRGEMLTFY